MSGDHAQGYSDLRRAMDLDPFDSWPVINMADFLEKDGRWPEALQYFDKAALRTLSRSSPETSGWIPSRFG